MTLNPCDLSCCNNGRFPSSDRDGLVSADSEGTVPVTDEGIAHRYQDPQPEVLVAGLHGRSGHGPVSAA